MYTLSIYNKDIIKIESRIKEWFNVKFIAFDQYDLKVSFTNELTDEEEIRLFKILEINKN
jgi:hypothetical protein